MTLPTPRPDWMPATGEDVIDQRIHFAVRVIQDCMAEAKPMYWDRRARLFGAALPRPDDSPGAATTQDIADRCVRVADQAHACRARAALLRGRTDVASPAAAQPTEYASGAGLLPFGPAR